MGIFTPFGDYDSDFHLQAGIPSEASGDVNSQEATSLPSQENNAPTGSTQPSRGILDKLLGIGGERYQTWPERMVRGAIDSMALPGDVLSGKVEPGSPQEIERAFDLAGLMVGGPAPVASRMADGTLGSFAGVRSKTFPKEDLQLAQKMESEGSHPDDIWNQTGFFKDKSDNRWKYEIPDNNAKLNDIDWVTGQTYKMSDILDHPDLYAAYPDLKNVNFKVDNNAQYIAAFSPDQDMLTLNPSKIKGGDSILQDIITHELQHKIQETEGFTSGSNPLYEQRKALSKVRDAINSLRSSPDDQRFNQLNNLYDDMTNPWKTQYQGFGEYMYFRQPGEIEANLAMARRLLTPEQRQMMSPQQMQDWLVSTNTKDVISGRPYLQPFYYPNE